jgi:predicted DCC family thiol-disulfide oxidoreductase YuxK
MFSSLQSPLGQLVLKENQLDHTNLSTIIFIQEKKIYLKSDAILCIASHLCNPYSFTGQALGYIPAFIRNIIYDLVAKYRLYINKWSRLNQVCSMPDPAVSSRILLSPLYPL